MSNEAELRREITQLRVLAEATADRLARSEILALIKELESRLRDLGNGSTTELAGTVW